MSTSAGPDVVESGLVLYLDAGNTRSYPGSGTAWFDLSGNGRNGTMTNGPTFNSSNNGSMVFDGINDIILLPHSSTILPLPNMSWEITFKTPSLPSGMVDSGLVSLNYGMVSYISGTTGRLFFEIYDGSTRALIVNNTTNYFDNQWHHAVFIINGGFGYIYVDGILTASNAATNANRTGTNIWAAMSMRFPDNPNNVNYKFGGSVSSVKIYNRGLSASEVVQNFNATRGRFGI